jgi:hypothetical protein
MLVIALAFGWLALTVPRPGWFGSWPPRGEPPIRASQNDGTGGSLHRLAAFDSHGRFDDQR